YKLVPSTEPRAIDLTMEERTTPAIYRLDDDLLTLCVGHAEKPSRPAEFVARGGDGYGLMVLRREDARALAKNAAQRDRDAEIARLKLEVERLNKELQRLLYAQNLAQAQRIYENAVGTET